MNPRALSESAIAPSSSLRATPHPRCRSVEFALLTLLLGLCWSAGAVRAGVELDPARVEKIAAQLAPHPVGIGQPITDRAAWSRFATNAGFADLVKRAETYSTQAVPELPDDLFLDYSKTGNRDRAQAVMSDRQGRLATLIIAECLENRGRFIPPLTNLIAAFCAERTWVYPAHDGKLDNFYGRTVEMDLRATALAWELATADWLLGERLPAATRQLIRENVQRRVLTPFRDMAEGRRKEIYWLRATHNWNAVCLAGVAGAALALEDSPQVRARYIAAVQTYSRYFLTGFTPDGYCSEGLGYWNYGFGHYLMLGETFRRATEGKIDLLADPAARAPALFARRAEVLAGIYPTIADCSPGTRPDEMFERYIAERLGLNPAGDRNLIFRRPTRSLITLGVFAFLPDSLPPAQATGPADETQLRTWFSDGGVLICRTEKSMPFAAVLKGGHNAEHHNHNDVGSFSVVAGKTMVICDPGAEVYTARTFSGKRYDSKVLNSFGHDVPVIAGKLQRTGADARAVVRRTDFTESADTLVLDLQSAYAVPELKQLERTFVFHRGPAPELSVRDEVAFTTPQTFATALITWGEWQSVSDREGVVRDGPDAVRVKWDTGGRAVTVQTEVLDENVRTRTKPRRIGFTLNEPVTNVVVTMTITPEPAR